MDLLNFVSNYIRISKIKAVETFDVNDRKITYDTNIKNSKGISVLRGEEEIVRAFLVTKLVNDYGYSLSDIEFERAYSAGRPKKIKPKIDLILKHLSMKSIFYFIEIKAPNQYDSELESAIEEQLYKLANLENNSIDNLVYYSLHSQTFEERAFVIDFKKFPKYIDWNNNRLFSSNLTGNYGVHNKLSTLSYDDKIIDTIVENVIREFNEHAQIKDVPFALRFIAYSELALLDSGFFHQVNSSFFDQMTTDILLQLIQTAVKRYLSNIKIAEYNKVINDLEKFVKDLSTTTLGKRAFDDNFSISYFIDKINKKFMPIINQKNKHNNFTLNDSVYKYIYIYRVGDNSIISTPRHIVSWMVDLLNLETDDYFVDFCSGFGNFSLGRIDSLSSKNKEILDDRISGVETEEWAIALYVANLVCVDINNIQVQNEDMFKITLLDMFPNYDSQRSNLFGACMNPPFSDKFYAAELVLRGCGLLPENSLFAVIVPYFLAINDNVSNGKKGNAKKNMAFHTELMKNNTLLASFSMPNDMFGRSASAVVAVLLLKTGIPHLDQNGEAIEETFFMYAKDDGYMRLKNLRVEKAFNSGKNTTDKWLTYYKQMNEDRINSVVKKVGPKDEWLIEAYMDSDYTQINDKMFEDTIKNYLAYRIAK